MSTILFFNLSYSQPFLAEEEGKTIIEKYSSKFPKFFREFQYVSKNESKIKEFKFTRGNSNGTPAKASKDGKIILDVSYLETTSNNDFDDNRLVIVLYHELGHLYYNSKNQNGNVEDNEKFAFEFSLKRAKDLAVKGDCGPLNTGMKFMQLRSLSNQLQDPHVRALKRIFNEPLIKSYAAFLKKICN